MPTSARTPRTARWWCGRSGPPPRRSRSSRPTARTRRSSRCTRAASSRATSRAPSCRSPTSSRSTTASPARSRSTIRTASCRRSASSTCTCSARAATRSCGSASARTCARSTASRARRSRSGRRRARAVSVVGDFNYWDGRIHPMRTLGSSGIWELFLPGVGDGAHYKYEILAPDGEIRLKADPVAFETEVPPKTAAVVHDPQARVGGRGVARRAAQEQRARRPDVDLRGPPRLVAAEPARGQPPADLPRAGRRAERLRARTWASPTSSCCR